MKISKIKGMAIGMALVLFVVGCTSKPVDGKEEKNTKEQSQEKQVANEENTQNKEAIGEKSLSLDALKLAMKNENTIIVDTRLTDAFNGWALDGISKGGHIQGAVDFSANWIFTGKEGKKKASDEVLKSILETKGIKKDKHVILYDANGKDSQNVEDYLKKQGFENISIFDLNLWADSEDNKLVKFPNYEKIVPAVVVKDILDGNIPETFEKAKNVKIVEASWGEEKTSYKKGHIPTAFHINTDSIEPPSMDQTAWMLADDKTLTAFVLDHGFQSTDTVILTGEEQMAAYRVAVVLRYLGVQDVRVLNGGTQAWTDAGYTLEKQSHKPVPVESFGAQIPVRPHVIDTTAEMKKALEMPEEYTLVDNRTWEEHIGESTGYSYHDKKGRIPGAIYGYAGEGNAYSLSHFRNPDNTMRNPHEFIKMWEEKGIDVNRHLAFMCGSGWRAAEVFTYADVYGLKNISLYSDGWIGWSNDLDNPVETGVPAK